VLKLKGQTVDRLQKVIAEAGICSRRRAELLIEQGRVEVNGIQMKRLGTKVDLKVDHVLVDGKQIYQTGPRVYLLMNKPKGFLCTLSDPAGRPRVTDLLDKNLLRIFPVGRLDFNTEGLLLLTNDGDFANLISSAGKHCPKTYLAKVRGMPDRTALKKMTDGMFLGRVKLAPCRISVVKKANNNWLRITLIEGKNNQIRKMFDRLGFPVVKLRRTQIGFLKDNRLKPGEYRLLSKREIDRFKALSREFSKTA